MASSFHAPLVIARPTVTYAGNCGCGCGGSGKCGEYGILPVLLAPAAVAAIVGGVGQFTGYNFNSTRYAECPNYKAAVDAFRSFREKVIGIYGKYPRADVFVGGKGRKKPDAKDPNLRDERSAQRRLQVLKEKAKGESKVCKGQLKTGQTPDGIEGAETVGLETQTAAGGNTLLYVGAGVIGLASIGLLIAAKRRRAAKAAAASK